MSYGLETTMQNTLFFLLLPGIGNKSTLAISWRTMTKLAYLAKVVLIVFYKRHDKLRLMAIVVYLCRSSFGIGVLGLMTYQERVDDDDSSSSAVLSVYIILLSIAAIDSNISLYKFSEYCSR
jgi:hypothetical protein